MNNTKGRHIMNDYRNKIYSIVVELIDQIEENIPIPRESENKKFPRDIISNIRFLITDWYGENWEKFPETIGYEKYHQYIQEKNTDTMKLLRLMNAVSTDVIKELESYIYENNYRKAIQILCDLFNYSEEADTFFNSFIKEKNGTKTESKNTSSKSSPELEKKVTELEKHISKLEKEVDKYRLLFAVMNSPIIVSNNRIKFNSRYRNLDKLLDANLVMLEQYTENECAQLINILTSNYRKNKKAYISKDNYYMEFQIPSEYFEE